MGLQFENRADAGRRLATRLAGMALERPVVLALPRGGVPVAAEVARTLRAPLDLMLVRRIGAPLRPEVTIAALADGAEPALEIDEEALTASGASRNYVLMHVSRYMQEIERRRRLYLRSGKPLDLRGRTVVLVDDGIATGTTVRAALHSLRLRKPGRIVLAVPVAPAAEVERLRGLVGELVCLHAPHLFGAIGRYYADFAPTGDGEVIALLKELGPDGASNAA